MGIMGICFFARDIALAFPRSAIILSSIFSFFLLCVWRFLVWTYARKLHGKKKIVIFGNSNNRLCHVISNKYSRLYEVVTICSEYDFFTVSQIESVDEIFITEDVPQIMREKLLPLCILQNKEVYYIPNCFDLSIISSSVFKMDDIPSFRIPLIGLSPEENFVKRTFDLFFGFIASLLLIPFSLIIALVIKLDGGPVFYFQERLTKGGKKFNILKFRTMIPDAEKFSGPILAEEKDPRITKVGHFLRAVRLDEIPQFYNILKGDMSIVGPRPERPFFTEQFEKELPEYHYRLRVKAGLTGLAQVEGKYNTTMEDKLRYDLIYIHTYSILKDLLIMLQTVKILFQKSSTEGVNTKK
jgi:exopolysaccharide biosynthesis polyprenyl glycosylphosphotransferase